MIHSSLHSRVSSCCLEIVKSLCSQICDLEVKVTQLEAEVENSSSELEIMRHVLEQARTERDDLCHRFDYYRIHGREPDEEW